MVRTRKCDHPDGSFRGIVDIAKAAASDFIPILQDLDPRLDPMPVDVDPLSRIRQEDPCFADGTIGIMPQDTTWGCWMAVRASRDHPGAEQIRQGHSRALQRDRLPSASGVRFPDYAHRF
jgi:hypothetical protein